MLSSAKNRHRSALARFQVFARAFRSSSGLYKVVLCVIFSSSAGGGSGLSKRQDHGVGQNMPGMMGFPQVGVNESF